MIYTNEVVESIKNHVSNMVETVSDERCFLDGGKMMYPKDCIASVDALMNRVHSAKHNGGLTDEDKAAVIEALPQIDETLEILMDLFREISDLHGITSGKYLTDDYVAKYRDTYIASLPNGYTAVGYVDKDAGTFTTLDGIAYNLKEVIL